MLERYADAFAALSPEASLHLWTACLGKYPRRMPPPNGDGTGGPALLAACSRAGLWQAEVVMTIADSRDPVAVRALETLMGKPLRAPAAVPPPAGLPAAQRATGHRAPRKPPQRRDPRIVLSTQDNPRRPGTAAHDGYACWRVGDTVDQCLARGLPARYVRKDVRKGRVVLGPVPR